MLFRLVLIAFAFCASRVLANEPRMLGVLQPSPDQAPALSAAGIRSIVFSVSWDRFEPSPDKTDPAYLAQLRAHLTSYRAAGLLPVLDTGVQYPPAWLLALPHSRFQNQHGDRFIDPRPGMNVANFVFNQALRERQSAYLDALFRELGADWFAMRLGGGWYGELNYPPASFNRRDNNYWAFDDLAQGRAPGLPPGILPCPVPGWKPGQVIPGATSARRFAVWYLDSLRDYHDWQIATARAHFKGPLMMLYPSWGVRPGQLDAAIAANLSGATSVEKNGELPRGFDFARFIGGIRDPHVWVHCTWLDSDPAWSDDTATDPARWSPSRYLAHLARLHRPPLTVSAENTGGGGLPALHLSTQRARDLRLAAFYWAFAPDLFNHVPPELSDLSPAFLQR